MDISKEVLLVGNPALYQVSEEIKKEETADLKPLIKALHKTLMKFRKKHNRGRAIAAPQLGVLKRVIYMHMNDEATILLNPTFSWKSPEIIEIWDDCMSLPELLVKVKRHKSCRLKFFDMEWKEHEWALEGDLSELLQHEYDHLDGILATMRAIDGKSFAWASQKEYIDFKR